MKKIYTLKSAIAKASASLATAIACLYYQTTLAYASFSNPDQITISSTANADTVMGKFAGLIILVVRGGGLVLTIFGAVNLVKSFTDDNGQAKVQAGMMIGAGLILCFLKPILTSVGLIQ